MDTSRTLRFLVTAIILLTFYKTLLWPQTLAPIRGRYSDRNDRVVFLTSLLDEDKAMDVPDEEAAMSDAWASSAEYDSYQVSSDNLKQHGQGTREDFNELRSRDVYSKVSKLNEERNSDELDELEDEFVIENNVFANNNSEVSLSWDRYGNIQTFFGRHPKDIQRALLPDYKNPCHVIGGRLYCLPFFFLAGMPKCGTTDLWDKISQHPQVAEASKEPHWWTRELLNASLSLQGYMFQRTVNMRQQLKNAKNGMRKVTNMIVGDCSTSTFWENPLWDISSPHHKDTTPGTIQLIASVLPKAKFILALREPANRMYSEYLTFHANQHKSASDYEHQVLEEIRNLRECFNRTSQRDCVFTKQERSDDKPFTRIRLTLYSFYVEQFLKYFPREQLFIVRMEDWKTSCEQILPQIYKFLELDPLPRVVISPICRRRGRNTNYQGYSIVGAQTNSTRRIIRNFVAPFNERLANIMQDNRFLWEGID